MYRDVRIHIYVYIYISVETRERGREIIHRTSADSDSGDQHAKNGLSALAA